MDDTTSHHSTQQSIGAQNTKSSSQSGVESEHDNTLRKSLKPIEHAAESWYKTNRTATELGSPTLRDIFEDYFTSKIGRQLDISESLPGSRVMNSLTGLSTEEDAQLYGGIWGRETAFEPQPLVMYLCAVTYPNDLNCLDKETIADKTMDHGEWAFPDVTESYKTPD
ncbi:hypothetical protein QFC24_005317 [Naganishia onofrii]|uniref:Uncharacterized protein n=1 Tax=Naganishia onofrii TaxID=1851511 RepID=A0ACC2XAD3_9TREE|nr:hypothetical protein QFC24_005317 [Naganishia onofrii]